MAEKQDIYTSVDIHEPISPITTHSTRIPGDQQWRAKLKQRIHAGPGPCHGRDVYLMLDKADTFALGIALIGTLPFKDITGDNLEQLKTLVRMAEIALR